MALPQAYLSLAHPRELGDEADRFYVSAMSDQERDGVVLVDPMAGTEYETDPEDFQEPETVARTDLIFHATSRYSAEGAELVSVFGPGRLRHTTITVATIDLSSGSRVCKVTECKTHAPWGRIKWSRG